ncbi:hypothetical protein NX862_16210 [Rhodobacter sp. KR11]|uniref:hypothetical protein n=1 Tax=Rhodobacter sp. KR11 TaxID=2974588 RepID=UPI0022213D6C|nr:hypothetical protein [Rhodobacter sp. KR11]MCW1920305.1 hypothetical protein [Rhodobacter sp. KR11]
MIAQRLGRIFDPLAHTLPCGAKEFAQSPQALEFPDFTRVYFCARSVDDQGFRAQVAFADMTKDFARVLRVSSAPVLPLGDLGTFDEHGIFPFSPIRKDGQVWAYTCGWNRRASVSVDTAVGLAVSDDGESFRRLGPGPILGPSLKEPFLVGDAFVIQAQGRFHMWYMFGQRWKRETPEAAPDRVYKIGHAVSDNGVDWVKEDGIQILPDRLGPDECQALPSVLHYGGRYHMVFCFREVHGFRTDPTKGYRIGYAWSADLVTWTRDDAALGLTGTPGDWDSDMQCYPNLCLSDGEPYLLYNGNAFGRFGFGAVRLSL